jgi:hypothetical protein
MPRSPALESTVNWVVLTSLSSSKSVKPTFLSSPPGSPQFGGATGPGGIPLLDLRAFILNSRQWCSHGQHSGKKGESPWGQKGAALLDGFRGEFREYFPKHWHCLTTQTRIVSPSPLRDLIVLVLSAFAPKFAPAARCSVKDGKIATTGCSCGQIWRES